MRNVVIVLMFVLLQGCSMFSHQDAVPVEAAGKSSPKVGFHTIRKGETLYEIAFQYGWDYRELAAVNNIQPPYVIYPGQKLVFKKMHKPVQTRTQKPAVLPVTKKFAQASKVANPIVLKELDRNWIWPAKGKMVKPFSMKAWNRNKGIDIQGGFAHPVYAAKAGSVVYSGAGLRGYGQLIIIKHNETYLSAYAYNSRLLAKEGDVVTQGQKIAEMGQSEANSVKLHFEIRKNGQPVDPLLYLPRV